MRRSSFIVGLVGMVGLVILTVLPVHPIDAQTYNPPRTWSSYYAEVIATGAAYTVTAVDAAVDFGGTDPVITLPAVAGTYDITITIQYDWSAATQVAESTLYTSLVETGGPTVVRAWPAHKAPILTAATSATLGDMTRTVRYVTATGGETFTLYTYLSALPDAGSLTVTAAEIEVHR